MVSSFGHIAVYNFPLFQVVDSAKIGSTNFFLDIVTINFPRKVMRTEWGLRKLIDYWFVFLGSTNFFLGIVTVNFPRKVIANLICRYISILMYSYQ